MFDALRDTVEEGHTNMFMQFYGEPGAFSIVGGLKLVGGKAVGGGIKDLLERLAADIDVEVGSVELDAESHNDISFHHIAAKDADEAERVFGDQLGVYIGADNRTLWFAIGGDAAFEKTTELMDILAEPKPANRKRTRRAPFQMIFNISQWLGLDEDGEGMVLDAFEDGGDRVTVDIRTTDDGMRIRAQAEEGVVRLLGMGIGRRFDRRGERRNRGGGRGRPGAPATAATLRACGRRPPAAAAPGAAAPRSRRRKSLPPRACAGTAGAARPGRAPPPRSGPTASRSGRSARPP